MTFKQLKEEMDLLNENELNQDITLFPSSF